MRSQIMSELGHVLFTDALLGPIMRQDTRCGVGSAGPVMKSRRRIFRRIRIAKGERRGEGVSLLAEDVRSFN